MGSKYFLTWALVIVFLYFLGLEAYIHKLGADCPYLDKECFMLGKVNCWLVLSVPRRTSARLCNL